MLAGPPLLQPWLFLSRPCWTLKSASRGCKKQEKVTDRSLALPRSTGQKPQALSDFCTTWRGYLSLTLLSPSCPVLSTCYILP